MNGQNIVQPEMHVRSQKLARKATGNKFGWRCKATKKELLSRFQVVAGSLCCGKDSTGYLGGDLWEDLLGMEYSNWQGGDELSQHCGHCSRGGDAPFDIANSLQACRCPSMGAHEQHWCRLIGVCNLG